MSELGGGESATRVLVFEKGREAWKSQSHISAHFAPVEAVVIKHIKYFLWCCALKSMCV